MSCIGGRTRFKCRPMRTFAATRAPARSSGRRGVGICGRRRLRVGSRGAAKTSPRATRSSQSLVPRGTRPTACLVSSRGRRCRPRRLVVLLRARSGCLATPCRGAHHLLLDEVTPDDAGDDIAPCVWAVSMLSAWWSPVRRFAPHVAGDGVTTDTGVRAWTRPKGVDTQGDSYFAGQMAQTRPPRAARSLRALAGPTLLHLGTGGRDCCASRPSAEGPRLGAVPAF